MRSHLESLAEPVRWHEVREIVAALKRHQLDNHTLIVWTSDNGAVQRTPPQGSNAPYRGFGYDTSEGARRMQCIMRWSGRIPANVVNDELCSTLDLLPTFAALAAAKLPSRAIDGHDIAPLLFRQSGTVSPWDAQGFWYDRMGQLQAIRAGDWKLYLPLPNKFVTNGRKTAASRAELYDVRHDVAEQHEVSAAHPDVVRRQLTLAERIRQDMGDEGIDGPGRRPAGWVERPLPLLKPD